MEANVLFIEDVIARQPNSDNIEHTIFFADGFDPAADLQVAVPDEPLDSARNLLATIFDWKLPSVEYRNHKILNAAGANDPGSIRRGFDQIVKLLKSGDRFFVYVTAHGGSDKEKGGFDTSIYGWNRGSIRASEFALWLDQVPSDVPVFMVMAQCYCGGYAHTIFSDANQERGLAAGIRLGFFAQQHNLPAAGCRPDISNDQEYSSYFWGAIRGQTRTGTPIVGADRDGDGRVSFAEAHVYAVLAGDTIDIPLRCSDVLLRTYSQSRSDYMKSSSLADHVSEQRPTELDEPVAQVCDGLIDSDGTLGDLIVVADFVNAEIVAGIAEQLGVPLTDTIADVEKLLRETQLAGRSQRRRGRSTGQADRQVQEDLRDELLVHWPELAKAESFDDLAAIGVDFAEIQAEIGQWPRHRDWVDQLIQRQSRRETSRSAEFDLVRLKRLMQSVDMIVLAHNLPHIAPPEVLEKYEAMLALEHSAL